MNPLSEHYTVSHDFLRLIEWKKNNNNTKEAETLQAFYEDTLAIATRASEKIHTTQLACATEHFKAKILEMELKQSYNELFQKYPAFAADLITKSVIPTKKQFESDVFIK